MFFGELAVHFSQFCPLLPLTEVSPRPSAIPGGNPPGDGQSAVGWGDAGFEPGTAGQQSGALPLSHHASLFMKVLGLYIFLGVNLLQFFLSFEISI
jgi:hypothetical protein